MRAAQEALRQALERGASPEELKKLMDDLRAALDKFMQALAEQMKKNPEQLARPLDRNSKTLTQKDLKSMLDRLEQLARSGNKEAAQRLLEQLQSMLENLQMAQPNAGDDGGDDMNSALDELSDMIRKQQQLRDKTFKKGQDLRRDRPGNDKSKKELGDLRQDQKALRDRLKQLLDQLRQHGLTPGQKKPGQQTTRATRWISSATPASPWTRRKANWARATPTARSRTRARRSTPCARARRVWRRRCRTTASARARTAGPTGPQARAQNDTDPLGRPLRGHDLDGDNTVKVPGEIDAQRARRILEELRKRFGESFRPQLELDYIERLLKDF